MLCVGLDRSSLLALVSTLFAAVLTCAAALLWGSDALLAGRVVECSCWRDEGAIALASVTECFPIKYLLSSHSFAVVFV